MMLKLLFFLRYIKVMAISSSDTLNGSLLVAFCQILMPNYENQIACNNVNTPHLIQVPIHINNSTR
jgi:hypothetical protein